ncbi:MAG: homoserine O-acetyltransferase [Candidatus Aureabacteria bacterium]|nr:homoserine O-acetyltransferase [Candidatus Auribacterota bacterium]
MNDFDDNNSIGIVRTNKFVLSTPENIALDCGEKLSHIEVAYETYGSLNKDKSNAVLILHALSGDAHAAGFHSSEDKKPGWWDNMIGPGKCFDTRKYYVICSNFLGGCKGTTGSNSINPKTGKEYGMSFPVVSIKDMVKVQKELIDFLEIKKLLAVCGGSMGGMQALQWSVDYSDMAAGVIPIATTATLSPLSIALNEVGRKAIMNDPNWNNGNYYESIAPDAGLAVARMLGHITYLSDEAMRNKFGRRLQKNEEYRYDFEGEFQVESYLHHQGTSFTKRFDANTYLYVTKAMDYFDLSREYSSLEKAFETTRSRFLVIAFSSDWLFPPYQAKEIVKALRTCNKEVSYCELSSSYGHDAFLLEEKHQTLMISHFLMNLEEEYTSK